MVDINQILTVCTVSYKAKNALQVMYESLRSFYPNLPFLIIDGSPDNHPCQTYVNSLTVQDPNVLCFTLGYNIGHGRGMNLGITITRTDYVLVCDSDIEFIKPCIEKMLELFEQDVVSVGEKYEMGIKGIKGVQIPYVHPWFHIVDRIMYFHYFPYVHSGAPTHIHNSDIYLLGQSGNAYRHFPVEKYVKHHKGATRLINDDIDGKKAERKTGESDARMWMKFEKGLEVKHRRLEKLA